MFCAIFCVDIGEEPARNRSTAAVMRFLVHIEYLDSKLNPKRKQPIWLAKFNFLGLLRVCESFSDFQHVRNLYEGGVIGEGVVKELRPLVAKGIHVNWATNLLLSHYRHLTIDMLIEVTKETTQTSLLVSNCPLGDSVELSKFQRFSTIAEGNQRLKNGKPLPVLLFGGEANWKIGIVVVFKKYWFFREIQSTMDDSIDDVYGISFHRVILESEDICLG